MRTKLPSRGFTLIEAVVVIVITGIIASVVAKFIVKPVEGYADLTRRAEMTDTADTALRRMGRDLRLALPNSVRVSGNTALEFLSTSMGGRYRVGLRTDGSGDTLDFTNAADTTFDIMGTSGIGAPKMTFPAYSLENQNQIVIYNLGIQGADAYQGSNRRAYNGTTGAVSTVTMTSTQAFPFDSPAHRFQVVDTPVSYICDLTAHTLTRYWGYTISSAQQVPPSTTTKAVLATNVSNCIFNYAILNERNSLVTMQISIANGGETITLYHEVHVSNVP